MGTSFVRVYKTDCNGLFLENMVNENLVKNVVKEPYKYGFVTDIETEKISKGLNEDIIRLISQKKEEPKYLLDFRLKAFKKWQKMDEPDWAGLGYKQIDYQDIIYYSAPKQKEKISSLDEVDPKLLETFDKLGIPLRRGGGRRCCRDARHARHA